MLPLAAAGGTPAPLTAIKAGRLLDVAAQEVRENVVILVEGARVKELASSVPPGATVIDLSSQTVLPGFIDGHTHVLLQGDATSADYDAQLLKESLPYRALRAGRALRIALDHGFTTLRDIGNEGAGFVDVDLKHAVEAGVLPGPRLFVATKGGTVRIIQDGTLLPTPFLDISSIVHQNSEQGFLGLAFDPAYATNGRFFVSYTSSANENVVASYTVSTADPNVANPVAEDIRLRVPQPRSNHNGGNIVFGPDGYLYVGRGDGGGGGDPDHNGQSTATLLGKILRLDVSGASGYSIPSTNPFFGSTESRPEIWSWGLRNPWQFTFDRANGDLYIADVGQDDWEEVNVATAASGAGRDRAHERDTAGVDVGGEVTPTDSRAGSAPR